MTNKPTITITAYGAEHTIVPHIGRYANDRIAIQMMGDDGPFGTLTINLPDVHLNEGEVLIKDWAENEPMAAALKAAGWITPTGREVASGYVFPMVARPDGPLAEYIASL